MEMVPDDWDDKVFIGVAPKTDRCGEEFWGIFKHEGSMYRVNFTWGTDYYMSEVGEWDDPFPQVDWSAEEIECEEVRAVPVTTYTYEPIEEAA